MLAAYARLEETVAPVFRRAPDLTRETVTLLASNIYCDTTRARQELGFECVSMERMLRETMDWMVEAGLLASVNPSNRSV